MEISEPISMLRDFIAIDFEHYQLRPYHYNSQHHQDEAEYLYRANGLPGGSKPAVVLHSEAKRQLA